MATVKIVDLFKQSVLKYKKKFIILKLNHYSCSICTHEYQTTLNKF